MYTLSTRPLLHWRESSQVRGSGKRQNVTYEFQGDCTVTMTFSYCIWPAERRILTFLHGLRKLECHDGQWCVPDTANGCIYHLLGKGSLFLTVHANPGDWQIKNDDQDKERKTFPSHHGLYRLLRTLFELKNVPNTCKLAVNIIMSMAKGQFALVYLDDSIIFRDNSRSI